MGPLELLLLAALHTDMLDFLGARGGLMEDKRFTKEEAEALVGKRIHTLAAFSRVPKGTEGLIVRADYMGLYRDANENLASEYDVVVRWELPEQPTRVHSGQIAGEPVTIVQAGGRLEDWFSKGEYEQYLEELPD